MGIEQLNSAVWAAGFAMASSEEDYREGCAIVIQPAQGQWMPSQAILVREPDERADWFKGLLGLLGRRDRVSPA
jgi:hypothetical protein